MFKRRNKYGNKIVVIDGIEFQSKLEGERYLYLRSLEKKGYVLDLRRQVHFEVIPAQQILVQRTGKSGQPLKPKVKNVERNTEYIADFVYYQHIGNSVDGRVVREVIEDTKGAKTRDYVMKRKLMRLQGLPITEVSHATQPIQTEHQYTLIPYEDEESQES